MNVPAENANRSEGVRIISSLADQEQNQLNEQYMRDGCTSVFRALSLQDLAPLHQLIYEKTLHLLTAEDRRLSPSEAIRRPFCKEPDKADVISLVKAVEESDLFRDILQSDGVRSAFERIFNTDQVIPFPISRLRAQFPMIEKTTYDWHQDEGTWYAIKAKSLAYKMPATLWLSINGADSTNSIEIVPGTHRCKLQNHYLVAGQGFFNARVPKEFAGAERVVVKTEPGEAVAFHPLTFHRSIPGSSRRPRYSIDIRYYTKNSSLERYAVSLKFLFKRFIS